MAEGHSEGKAATGVKKKPTSLVLRERLGGVPKEVTEAHKQRQDAGRKIVRALRDGPRTVPELADATGLPAHQVLWHIMGMRKYGKVLEGEEQDGYFQYALEEKEE